MTAYGGASQPGSYARHVTVYLALNWKRKKTIRRTNVNVIYEITLLIFELYNIKKIVKALKRGSGCSIVVDYA